jgi:hypothetical protein
MDEHANHDCWIGLTPRPETVYLLSYVALLLLLRIPSPGKSCSACLYAQFQFKNHRLFEFDLQRHMKLILSLCASLQDEEGRRGAVQHPDP